MRKIQFADAARFSFTNTATAFIPALSMLPHTITADNPFGGAEETSAGLHHTHNVKATVISLVNSRFNGPHLSVPGWGHIFGSYCSFMAKAVKSPVDYELNAGV